MDSNHVPTLLSTKTAPLWWGSRRGGQFDVMRYPWPEFESQKDLTQKIEKARLGESRVFIVGCGRRNRALGSAAPNTGRSSSFRVDRRRPPGTEPTQRAERSLVMRHAMTRACRMSTGDHPPHSPCSPTPLPAGINRIPRQIRRILTEVPALFDELIE